MKGDREKCLEAGASGISGEAGEYGTAAFSASHVAASIDEASYGDGGLNGGWILHDRGGMRADEKVNILMVDDQPAKLLSLRSHS